MTRRDRRPQTPESKVKAEVRRTCAYLGVLIYPIVGSPLQPPGLPDYWGIYRGQAVCIEVKGPNGKLSQAQEIRKREIEAAGGIFILARSGADVAEGIGVKLLF